MPQRHCQNNCSWAWRLIYRSTSVGLNLRVAVPCLVDPLDSFGFQSCTAYAAKQRWNNGGEMSGSRQTQSANCSIFVHSHMHTVSSTCVNIWIDSASWKQTQRDSCSWTVGDVCLWVQLSSPNDRSLIMSTSKHLLMEEKRQAQTQSTHFLQRRKSVMVCQMLVSNQRRLRNQRLDCEPLSGWERTGRFDELSEEKQLQAANWKAFVRSCSALCCLLPPLLKVLACRCLLSFLMCNYKDGRTA